MDIQETRQQADAVAAPATREPWETPQIVSLNLAEAQAGKNTDHDNEYAFWGSN